MTSKVVYALHRDEYQTYLNDIFQNRSHAFEFLFDFLNEKDPQEYISTFSYLAEYFSILYQFENLLEDVTVGTQWDEPNSRWIMDEHAALTVVVHVRALHICHQELLNHNISFSIH